MPRLLIAASGTGGHIFPALSVAKSLSDSWKICWLGVPDRLENEVVPTEYEMTTIRVSALQAKGIRKIFQMMKLLISTVFVVRLIRRRRIQMVFTTGGYIAAPAIIASKLCGISVVLHESNAFPGKVTRLLGRFCNEVALGLPIAAEQLKSCQTVLTGTPIRNPFLLKSPLPTWVPNGSSPLIVVLGGSQGAMGLNRMTRKLFPWLLKKGCRIVHVTGKSDQYSDFEHKNLVAKPFTKDIPGLLQHAHLVISRAGSGALSELAACHVPAILVPYPYAADNHQEINAEYAAQHGAAIIVHENQAGEKSLKRILESLLVDFFDSQNLFNHSLNQMSKSMERLAFKDAHLRVVDVLKKYVY